MKIKKKSWLSNVKQNNHRKKDDLDIKIKKIIVFFIKHRTANRTQKNKLQKLLLAATYFLQTFLSNIFYNIFSGFYYK